jgi:hypothetical protein
MDKQKAIDEKAIREKKSVGSDDQGGQDRITSGQKVKSDQVKVWGMNINRPKFRGITHK